MDLEELKKTDLYLLFEKGLNYMRMHNVFRDTDVNYRMYNGNQWEGAKIEGIEQAQYNFIETIVNYKVSVIHNNEWAVHYSSENYESKEYRKTADKTCELLDKKASKVWENDKLSNKFREATYDSAINDEGIMYTTFDKETQEPKNEVLDKNDVQYGNEQSEDIQSQPYIIISQRKPVINIIEYAKANDIPEENLKYIVGDSDTHEQPGEDAKIEKEDMCTFITKFWKENGTVWYEQGTKFAVVKKATNSGLKLYPIAHMTWKHKKGSARGEGEVRYLRPNQLELNKTLARMLLSIKQCAYAQKVANLDKIANPDAINQIGGIIKTKAGMTVDDVSKIFTYIQPATMSTDVSKLINDLISITRELKSAGDIATGGVNPEDASGKAILAVQQASQQPLNDQLIALKQFIEDVARIWLDMWTTYTDDVLKLEEEVIDPRTGDKYYQIVEVPTTVLDSLKGTVKVDITPKSPYDKYARELSLENLLKAGYFNAQRVKELRYYAEALPDDSVMPKQDILEICDKIEEEQQKIAMIQQQAQLMQQRANNFLMADPEAQAQQVIDAQQQVAQQVPQENTDEEVPVTE